MSILSLFKKQYHSLNTIEVSKEALLGNYNYLSSLDENVKVAPVLKSNAYGHGLTTTAEVLDQVHAPFFCVDSIYEGYELLRHGIKTPILIMGYINPENLKVKKLPFSYAVYNKEQVLAISTYQPHAGIHIFVDTGMHREGTNLSDLPDFVAYIKTFGKLRVEGLMSHLAAGDQYDNALTKKQIENFAEARKIVTDAGFRPQWVHIGASSALLNHEAYKGKMGNIARCGISLYGIDPEGKDKHLEPALRFSTTLTQVKVLQKGEKVGYDFTYTAPKDMAIGTLPVGYYDGVDRRLSDKGFVLIDDVLCPIIGRISMNIMTVDLSAVKNPEVGGRVIVYSDNPTDKNSVYNASLQAGTIPYDILVGLAATTKRVYR